MIDFRVRHSSWYQVPVLYGWWDLTAGGALVKRTATGHGHGTAATAAATAPERRGASG